MRFCQLVERKTARLLEGSCQVASRFQHDGGREGLTDARRGIDRLNLPPTTVRRQPVQLDPLQPFAFRSTHVRFQIGAVFADGYPLPRVRKSDRRRRSSMVTHTHMRHCGERDQSDRRLR